MEKVKICFSFYDERHEIELSFEEFGKYCAASISIFNDRAADFDSLHSRPVVEPDDEFINKYCEIPFMYDNEEYRIALYISDYLLSIYKPGDDEPVEYSDFVLSFE